LGDPRCIVRALASLALAARCPTLIADNRRMQAVGPEQWLEKQRECQRRGFVYTDICYRG
jgi:hypothetical protein